MKKTIVVIDDEPDILDIMQTLLEEQGYGVFTAVNAEDGLEQIKKNSPHLIILDVMMPKKDGFDILTDIKKDKRGALVPVIMMSARREFEFITKAQNLQAADYLTKPFDSDELLRVIKRYEKYFPTGYRD
jgi:DNA-binding response OmpR family regulator